MVAHIKKVNHELIIRVKFDKLKKLTYMATINYLERKGALVLYKADLRAGEQKERALYFSPDLPYWIENHLDMQPKDRHKHLLPSEQVEEIFDQFVRGHHMGRNDMKKLEPVGQHVWEFKTEDVRVFGYFYRKQIFIAVCGEMRKKLKPANQKYKHFINQVLKFRNSIDLDEPKYMEEELYGLI